MASEWRTLSLSETPIKIIDGDRGKNYPKQADFAKKGFCLFLNTGNVTENGFDFSDCSFITEGKDNTLRKGKLIRNDVVLTTRGTVGNVALYDNRIPFENIRINSGMVILRADPKHVLPNYLYLLLRSKLFKEQTNSLSTGSAQPQLPIRDINRVNISIPPLAEQKAIAHILGNLDYKIGLDHQINKTLEAIGQALFKRWFIDFEFPNGKGRPYKSSGGEMVDSELGKMPRGWAVKKIGEVLELAYGKGLKETGRYTGRVPVYGSNGRVGWHNEVLVDGPGIVVGRKGNPGTVIWVQTSFYPIDTTFFVVPKSSVRSMYYLFYTLKTQDLPSLSADSAVPGLNRNIVYMNDILIPPMEVLEIFDAKIEALFKKMHANESESSLLGDIRDKLLPRFMSGKIRVKGVRDESKM